MKNELNTAVIRGLYTAVNERNFDYLEKVSDETSEWFDIPFNIKLTGKESVTGSWQNRFNMFPDATFEIKNLISSNDCVIVQGLERGTYKDVLSYMDEDIVTSSPGVEIGFCDVYYLREGKIIKANSNFDIETLILQITAIPAE